MFQIKNLAKYSFIRILIPLVVGICIGEFLSEYAKEIACTLIGICSLGASILFLIYFFRHTYANRWLFGAGIFLSFLLLGLVSSYYSGRKTDGRWSNSPMIYQAELLNTPQVKEKSILCHIRLNGAQDSSGWHFIDKEVLLYLSKDSLSRKIVLNDDLMFYGHISSPANNGNPGEFDYARFLRHKGISGIAYVDSGYWQTEVRRNTVDLKRKALLIRDKVLQKYRDLGIAGNEFAVLSALTVGYKDELSKDIRESYSIAGASHILALSGLHIGILCSILFFILNLLFGKNSFYRVKGVLLLIGLWLFAFIAGLSPSVVRAVVMFSLLTVARMFGSHRTSLNTVCGAALLMLLWNPYYLYDVSFQLSFLAVINIIIIGTWVGNKIVIKNCILRKMWMLITVSVAAQIGTLPMVLYYFSRFPIYSLLISIPVIALVYVIFCGALILLSISFFPMNVQQLLADGLAWMVKGLNSITTYVESMPAASLEDVNFQVVDVWCCYLMLLLLIINVLRWVRIHFVVWEAIICFLCIFHVVDYSSSSLAKHPMIVFYNSSYPMIQFVCPDRESYLQMDAEDVKVNWKYATDGLRKSKKVREITVISSDYEDKNIWSQDNITGFKGYTVCIVKDGRWKNKIAALPLRVDYLYLTKGYKGDLKSLASVFRIRRVVLNKSLGGYRLNMLKNECRVLGLDYVSLQEDGALTVNI